MDVDVELLGGSEMQKDAETAVKAKAIEWHGATVEPLLAKGDIFSEPKHTLSKTEISLAFSSNTAIGKFEWKLTVVGLGTGLKGEGLKASLKVAAGEVVWTPLNVHLGPQTLGTFQFKDIVLKPGGKIEAAPNYVEIIKQWVVKKVEEEVAEAVEKEGGEVAATIISFDALIAASLGAVAVGTVLGVAGMFVAKVEKDKILHACSTALIDLNHGVRAGLAGEPNSGSDMFQAGWSIGDTAHQDAIAKINAELAKPGAEVLLPEEFTARVKAAADKAVKSWGAWGELDGKIRDMFWHRWADESHGISTTLGDAKVIVSNIYGADEDEKGLHMIYWSKQSFFNNKPGFWSV
jgi:hypothetical protein